jgi:hypothetical protein
LGAKKPAQNKWEGASLTFTILKMGLGGEQTKPQMLILRCSQSSTCNILLKLALEAAIRQNKGKGTYLTFNMLKMGLGGG